MFSDLRNSRQKGFLPGDMMTNAVCVVIGTGAVGHQAATTLASSGAGTILLFDDDTINEENLAPQKFFESQLGKKKAEAVGEECLAYNSRADIKVYARKFGAKGDEKFLKNAYVFCCVDTMAGRKKVYEMACGAGAKWFGDSRTLNEVSTVFSVPNPGLDGPYLSTIFSDTEAYVGSCTTKMTAYGAGMAAAIVMSGFSATMRGETEYRQGKCCLMDWEFVR